ncbi:MAG: threonylcarbamoyl-AMP synthase [Anaerolineae bacterium]|nr:threonylcarbamoyl-AMP synthase [Anaerolineae bacterium]
MTEILPIDHPKARALAAEALREGKLVVLPTDTVYGVAAHPSPHKRTYAVAALYTAKGRAPDKAIPVLLSSMDKIEEVALPFVQEASRQLALTFWPGPLTLVVPKRPGLSPLISKLPTVGVRVPDHAMTRAVIAAAGGALAVTSANRAGAPNPITVDDAVEQLGNVVALYLDGGPCPGGQPSTVVQITDEGELVIFREGPVSAATLRAALADGLRTYP